tara:strand:+ start:906 stop:1034 length:129 start_codon:yes stop_codon:yes gene_type:complete
MIEGMKHNKTINRFCGKAPQTGYGKRYMPKYEFRKEPIKLFL